MNFKKFKLDDINPIGVVYFILVLALLIIVTNQGKMNKALQGDILEVQQQFTSSTQKYQEHLLTAKAQLQNAQEELSWQITGLEKKLIEKANNYSIIVKQKNYQINRTSLIISDLESKIEGYESQLKIAQTQLEIVQSNLATTTEALTDAVENPVCPTTTCPDTQ